MFKRLWAIHLEQHTIIKIHILVKFSLYTVEKVTVTEIFKVQINIFV